MCLIIQRPANKELDFEKFKTAVDNNPDGWGLSASLGDGELQTIRTPEKTDPEAIYRMVQEEFSDVPVLLHLRYTTAGKTILRNAHPFPILEKETDGIDLRMAHNGTLSKYKPKAGDESDTRVFVRNFVRPLFKRLRRAYSVEELLKDRFVHDLIDDQLSAMSVVSFIDGDGNVLNVNHDGNGGFYEDGVYYSNKYSFDPLHREDWSMHGYGGSYKPGNYANNHQASNYSGPKSGTVLTPPPPKPGSNSVKAGVASLPSNHAKDTKVTKFTDRFDLGNEDLLEISDDLIDIIVDDHPDEAKLLIKELQWLLYEETKGTIDA